MNSPSHLAILAAFKRIAPQRTDLAALCFVADPNLDGLAESDREVIARCVALATYATAIRQARRSRSAHEVYTAHQLLREFNSVDRQHIHAIIRVLNHPDARKE